MSNVSICINKYFLYLKNHPLKKLEIEQHNLKIIDNIDDFKNKIDLAIVGNKTAASLDLYYKNYNILIFLDSNDLDYSPLHKFIDYKTFFSVNELRKLLDIYSSKLKYSVSKNIKKKYFITNKNYRQTPPQRYNYFFNLPKLFIHILFCKCV